MSQVRSTTIIPVAIYCFILGVYFLSLGINAVLSSKTGFSSTDFTLWATVAVCIVLAVFACVVGVGVLQLHPLSWKVLFFALTISISSITAFVIIFLVFLATNIHILAPYYKIIQDSCGGWFAFISFFLSEIIILYYFSSEEIVSLFGGAGQIISPF